jgi:hypothetical protein
VVAATDMEDRVEALIQRGMDVVKKQVQLCVHGQKTIRIALTDAGSRDPFGRLIDDSCGVLARRGFEVVSSHKPGGGAYGCL